MRRRTWTQALASLPLAGMAGWAGLARGQAGPALSSLVVLDVELVDDHQNPAAREAQQHRLADAGQQLRRELADGGLYRVIDPLPPTAAETDRRVRGEQEFMHRCDDCAVQIGQAAGADLVMTPWVDKTSELILYFALQIVDVRKGRPVFMKAVSMRGNRDDSWARAVHYLVRDIAQKRAGDAGYAR